MYAIRYGVAQKPPSIMKVPISILFILMYTLSFAQGDIFSSEKTIIYAIEHTTDSIVIMDTVKITATGKPWQVAPDKQLEIIITYDFESLDTSIFRNISSIGWVNSDTTGAVDNEETCWFHPPRHNQYKILELAPFPTIEYPLHVDKTYSRVLFIGEGWGDISNTKVVWNYKVIGQVDDLWRISAQATPDNNPTNPNHLDYVFSNNHGFIELLYTFYNGTIIKMKRIN